MAGHGWSRPSGALCWSTDSVLALSLKYLSLWFGPRNKARWCRLRNKVCCSRLRSTTITILTSNYRPVVERSRDHTGPPPDAGTYLKLKVPGLPSRRRQINRQTGKTRVDAHLQMCASGGPVQKNS
ncbi:MAG: hypothetical protein V1775_19090 [Bacteroidota bacterium]